MTAGYVMAAKENYDSSSASQLTGGTQSACFSLDPTNLACGYDFNRRMMMYLGCIIPNINTATSGWTNNTGFTLFDGATNTYAPGAGVNAPSTATQGTNFSPQVCQKSIDTDAVTFFQTYSSAKTVPANVGSLFIRLSTVALGSGYTSCPITVSGGGGTGMQATAILDAGGAGHLVNVHITNWGTGYGVGTPTFTVGGDGTGAVVDVQNVQTPSDGTWRWIGANFLSTYAQPNGPNLVNPRNSDFWCSAASCELYQFRYADNFAQTLAPALVAIQNKSWFTPVMEPVGIDSTWCYSLTNPHNNNGVTKRLNLILVPAAIQADETAAAAKLTYVIWDTPPFGDDYGARLTFGNDGNVYVFSFGNDGFGKWNWRLTRYAPPALSAFGSNAPGTMTDITPWGFAGPNADGQNYTFSQNANGSLHFALIRLPATNQLAAVLKFPKEASAATTDYTKTAFSCVYVTLGASPTYDYHPGFVTGYMNSNWVSVGTIPTTGWAVLDCRETNNYLEQSDYQYAGTDYTRRWFVFQCYPISAGVVDTSHGLMDVLVEYSFVSGSAPTVVTPPTIPAPGVLTDPEWSANYAAYQTAISQQNVVYNSTALGTVATGDFDFTVWTCPDPGIFDPTSSAFWFSGATDWNGLPSTTAYNAMFHLDSAFTSRAAYNASGQPNYTFGPISPPFLKLTFPVPSPPTFANGFVRSYVGNPQL